MKSESSSNDPEFELRLPNDGSASPIRASDESAKMDDVATVALKHSFEVDFPPSVPVRIGRYRVDRILGQGGFGRVFLAFDEQLKREVAIKVSRRHLADEAIAAYQAEARTVARLDHPRIVPVYDVGESEDFPFYFVSKFVDGMDLAHRIRQSSLNQAGTIDLIISVAEALNYAHSHGVVHRDIKPGNILLDQQGQAYVSDFGLALREEEMGDEPCFAGTPAYMSPEQARGEGHRVDGRSDIFSLGVVLYELLVGSRPFVGPTRRELLDQIIGHDPRPPRQIDETIPRELDRICLKAMSKRATDRYSTARDLADDLRDVRARLGLDAGTPTAPPPPPSLPLSAPGPPSSAGQPAAVIVPKGLRAFDAHDAAFFLEMIPGPRSRDGLPESLRFWKARIEERDPGKTFPVGLICGPSGSGKSSLVRAGLLPCLTDVIAIYVEATARETESRLLNGLRKHVPQLPQTASLRETTIALRRGRGLGEGKKVLVVLDQFEQWLQSHTAEQSLELVSALRQCDGGRIQCLILVRDDFWMATLQFMRELECSLLDGHNSSSVDLFPLRHAEKVLAAFGQAFGVLSRNEREWTPDQRRFLTQAVVELAQENKVIPVRLALFAEMMKNRDWSSQSLKLIGGAQGVGASFLEETFGAAASPPEHRYHLPAIRNVLSLLLPDAGMEIKGRMRSRSELIEASGYRDRERDFVDLIQILDRKLRIITLTDPAGKDGLESISSLRSGDMPNESYYELAHDYLVPSLRAWLTRKQRETARGRSELQLKERATLWASRPERQQMPTLGEWLGILWYTDRTNWNATQSAMMAAASRLHMRQILLGTVLLGSLIAGARLTSQWYRRQTARAEVVMQIDKLGEVGVEHVPAVLRSLEQTDRSIWEERVRALATSSDGSLRSRAILALMSIDDSGLSALTDRLLECERSESAVLRDELRRWSDPISRSLWDRIRQQDLNARQSLRAAAVLADYSLDAPEWDSYRNALAEILVVSDPFLLEPWTPDLQPVAGKLLPALMVECLRSDGDTTCRLLASGLVGQFCRADAHVIPMADLVDLALAPDARVRREAEPILVERRDEVLPHLYSESQRELTPDATERYQPVIERKAFAIRWLQHLGSADQFWTHLGDASDPRVRTCLINSFLEMNVGWEEMRTRMPTVSGLSRQAALLGFAEQFESLPTGVREEFRQELRSRFLTDPDAGVHAAAEHARRTIGDHDALARDLEELSRKRAAVGNWRILPNQLCMIKVTPPPGSTVDHPFEISSTEVTVKQFQQFRPDQRPSSEATKFADCPMNMVHLYDAMQFCRWLSEQESDFEASRCVYPPVETIGPWLLLAPDYQKWEGFRLPTEAEWDCAARAGTMTSHFFGDSVQHLSRYAWWVGSSEEQLWPVGLKRPNPLGLMDVYGNVAEWCHPTQVLFNPATHPVRGGGYRTTSRLINNAGSTPWQSDKPLSTIGVRVVRIPNAAR